MTAAGILTIRLLGRLEVEADGVPLRIAGRHGQALLALLALRPRQRLRDAIAADLWPDLDGPPAAALRQALWVVRSTLTGAGLAPDDWLDADLDTLGIHRGVRLELDTASFEHLLGGDAADDEDAALRLYRGDLLEGLGHECFAAERERLSDLYEDALASAAARRLERGDVRGARRAATDLLLRDPLREEAHAVLIGVYGRAGSRSQVVRQYRRLCTILRTELAVAPLPETDAAYRAAIEQATARSRERVAEPFERPAAFTPVLVTSASA